MCSELWGDLVSSMVQGQSVHNEEWEVTSFQPSPAAAKEENGQRPGRWRDDVEALCGLKWRVLRASLFFLNRHQLISPRRCPWRRRPCWAGRPLWRKDARGAPAAFGHKDRGRHRAGGGGGMRLCYQAPQTREVWGNVWEVHWFRTLICPQRPLPWEPGCFRAPSPPALRFLCLIAWWPIPWPPDPEKDRRRVFDQPKGTRGLLLCCSNRAV